MRTLGHALCRPRPLARRGAVMPVTTIILVLLILIILGGGHLYSGGEWANGSYGVAGLLVVILLILLLTGRL